MEVLKREHKLCVCCMEEHEVLTVREKEEVTYKGTKVSFDGTYEYCEKAETFFSTEEQMTENHNALVAAYEEQRKD